MKKEFEFENGIKETKVFDTGRLLSSKLVISHIYRDGEGNINSVYMHTIAQFGVNKGVIKVQFLNGNYSSITVKDVLEGEYLLFDGVKVTNLKEFITEGHVVKSLDQGDMILHDDKFYIVKEYHLEGSGDIFVMEHGTLRESDILKKGLLIRKKEQDEERIG